MILIKPLIQTNLETVHECFNQSFSDYIEPFDLSFAQFKYMMERRGCHWNLSFGAFRANELVGFFLFALADWNKKLTAYNIGTGIVPAHRGKGIAAEIFHHALDNLNKHGVSCLLLEVIKSNTNAYRLYKKLGFSTLRQLDCYATPINGLTIKNNKPDSEYNLHQINLGDYDDIEKYWDFLPTWQNSMAAILRKPDHFLTLGAFEKSNLIGYTVLEKHSGDVPQIAVHKAYRLKGLASYMLSELIKHTTSPTISLINIDAHNKAFKLFSKHLNLCAGVGQYEMSRCV